MLDRSSSIIIFVPMNKLPMSTRVQIINLLCEGNSLRATSRITGTSINTVSKLLVEVGKACMTFHNEKVVNVNAKRVQADEIWSFVYVKEKNASDEQKEDGAGDVWTWTAIDADTKLIISWFVGDRSYQSAFPFMVDLANRVTDRIQITTDAFHAYQKAVYKAFHGDVDYAKLVKIYGASYDAAGRYSPAVCTGTKTTIENGNPNPDHINTSYVERQNLTMRMSMRRFTRLTNAFSKKLENHICAISLHFVYYNFCRIHKTLRVTPAMEAGLTQDVMSIEDVVKLL